MKEKTLLQHYTHLSAEQWDYYFDIDQTAIPNPFLGKISHKDFNFRYFQRGGKVELFELCGIDVSKLRIPYHISSVFFMGIMIYYETNLHRRFPKGNNKPGYKTFPFIWFLIALFHDNAYQYENEKIKFENIEELYKKFAIRLSILDEDHPNCSILSKCRHNYFDYISKDRQHVDHGILGGILLYDKLYAIREQKKKANEQNLFWGKSLVKQYRLAAHAITFHNIWMPNSLEAKEKYISFGLEELTSLAPIKSKDFPLFYLLGIVDSIEPLKAFREEIDRGELSINQVIDNIEIEFYKKSITVKKVKGSNLDFDRLIKKAQGLHDWLDVEIIVQETQYQLIFS